MCAVVNIFDTIVTQDECLLSRVGKIYESGLVDTETQKPETHFSQE